MARSKAGAWRFITAAAVIGFGLGAVALASVGGEGGLRLAIRLTAREAVLIFLLVFVASPLNQLVTSPLSKWLLRNRRALGLSLATAMGAHLVFIVTLAQRYPESFSSRLASTTLVGGGFGYVVLALMTATSYEFGRSRIARSTWQRLHTTGVWTIFGIFTFSYLPRGLSHPAYLLLALPLLGVAVLRAVAHAQQRGVSRARQLGCG